MNMFEYFRDAVDRKANGHELSAYSDTPRRTIGWIDRADGTQREAGLFSHIKTQFSVLPLDIGYPEYMIVRILHISQEMRDANRLCREADWESIGLTWEAAREIIRSAKNRGDFFGNGVEAERPTA